MSKNTYFELIEYVTKSPTRMAALKAFSVRGFCTAQHIEIISKLSINQVRPAIAELSEPPLSLPACIVPSGEVFIQGQRGRPQKIYRISDAGKAVLQSAQTGLHIHLPQFHDEADLLHGFAEMEFFCAGFSQNQKLAIEQRLDYGLDGNFIIPDILLLQNQRVIFEIEQQARRVHQIRIEEKLTRLFQFFSSGQSRNVSKQVRLIFTTMVEHARTLEIWQSAIIRVQAVLGDLPFCLHWIILADFLKRPEWDGFESFRLLEVKQPATLPATPSSPNVQLANQDQGSMTEIRDLVSGWSDEFPQLHYNDPILEKHKTRVKSFFEIMQEIYEASHYQHSPTVKYAVFPKESISLLNRYLYLPQNKKLLLRLKRQSQLVQANHERVMLARIEIGKLCWLFIEHHGLSRGGPLQVRIYPPDFNSDSSDFSFDIRMTNLAEITGKPLFIGSTMVAMKPEEAALAWVLSALYLYPDELGLVEEKFTSHAGKRQLDKKEQERG